MNLLGWAMLLVSWTAILLLVAVCVRKILIVDRDNIHAPLDIDTDPHSDPK